jgi:two-component sensor histidine kinase/GAF domain-containing protein
MAYRLLTLIDWALIAVSIFNTIVLLWLGLTVLFNTERRTWGAWIAVGGLLLGAAFFAGHTAVVGRVIGTFSAEMEFWWRLGWLVLIALPYLWYLVMAWYTGALRTTTQRIWLISVSLIGFAALVLLLTIDPLPSYNSLLDRRPAPLAVIGGIPMVVLVYPVFSVLCTLLALHVLRTPTASDRLMGDLARRRAHPWLIGASLALFAVSVGVGSAAAWAFDQVQRGTLPGLELRSLALLISFDLLISGLIGVAVVLIGQAVVAYEVFTGTPLPRGEMKRQWRSTLMLAAGYAIAVGWSLSGAGIPQQPIYQILLATILMTIFIALRSWRAFAEQDRLLNRLRPFVASQRFTDQLTRPIDTPTVDPATPFHALCADLLGAEVAFLLPYGPLAPLAGPPLAYPTTAEMPPDRADQLADLTAAATDLCLPLDPHEHGGAIWLVPLRNEQGLIGMLLLGPKRDDELYTDEEIALARAAAERFLDARSGAELARRLVQLQRRRLAESQVIDQRTRRVLHDEVLPQIHTAALQLATIPTAAGGEPDPAIAAIQHQLIGVHRQISDLLHALPSSTSPQLSRSDPLQALRRTVTEELGAAFDRITWQLPTEAEAAAQRLDPLTAEAFYAAGREIVRNAARHARGTEIGRPLHLHITAALETSGPDQHRLHLQIVDDGVGIAEDTVTTGRNGHGLNLHSTTLAILGGGLDLRSRNGGPTTVRLSVPVTTGTASS